jgi:hypothetical protein
MNGITLILQVIALACFFIGWMNWSVPKSHPLAWMCGGFFWLLLSFMLGHFALGLHAVG